MLILTGAALCARTACGAAANASAMDKASALSAAGSATARGAGGKAGVGSGHDVYSFWGHAGRLAVRAGLAAATAAVIRYERVDRKPGIILMPN